jgi:hypothetical protein
MKRMENIILSVFESNTVEIENLNEGFFPVSPALAYLTLKRNTLKKLRKAGIDVDTSVSDDANRVKAKALIVKEKLRAGVGITTGKGDGATVYKLTPKQLEVLSELQEKYGSVITDDVMRFRTNVLAPYQLIKRMVKNNKQITSKDKLGMTHAQFKSSVESGKKKIEKRGEAYDGKSDDMQRKIVDLGKAIDNLKEILEDFQDKGEVREHIINRILKQYHLDYSEFENVSLEDLKRTFNELSKNNKQIKAFLNKEEDDDDAKDLKSALDTQDLVKRNIELRKGAKTKERKRLEARKDRDKITDKELGESVESEKYGFLFKGGKFNIALGKYMLRKEVISQIRDMDDDATNKMYITIVRELIDSAIERKAKMSKGKSGLRSTIEFNEIERKIFRPRPSSGKEYSGDLKDYVQVIKDEDFSDPKYIKRDPKLIAAEKKVEAEVKRFERSLKKQMEPEDFARLKKMRLINNLITVKEMSNPDKLFKSPKEIEKMDSDANTRKTIDAPKENDKGNDEEKETE